MSTDRAVACGGCGAAFTRQAGAGRPRRYCSDACKQAAYRKRLAELTSREHAIATLAAWTAGTALAERPPERENA
jgi:uncharacterized protein